VGYYQAFSLAVAGELLRNNVKKSMTLCVFFQERVAVGMHSVSDYRKRIWWSQENEMHSRIIEQHSIFHLDM